MRHTVILAILLTVWASPEAAADTYYIKEPLEAVPESAAVAPPGAASVTAGRLKDQKAILLKDGSLAWKGLKTDGDVFVEFWMKPEGWDALTANAVELLRLRIGTRDWTLLKPADSDALELRCGDESLLRYPIYNWTRQPWVGKDETPLWHYINIGLTQGTIRLTVDGFEAKMLKAPRTDGILTGATLHGGSGTAYSWFHVIGAPWPDAEALRTRYRSLHRGLPDLRNRTITVPRLARPPVIDGHPSADEWSGAARITGFSALRQTGMRGEDIRAEIGYDDRYLYMVIRTPYTGTLRAKHHGIHDMPLEGEESYEIFLHPPFTGVPDYCQLIGNPYGDRSDLKMMDRSWNGKWDWKTTVSDSEWIVEFRADFKGIDTPPPGDFSVWTMNMVNTYAKAGWCPTQRYNDSGSFGTLRFDANAPVIRPDRYAVTAETVSVPLELIGGAAESTLNVALQVFGEKDVLPASEEVRTVKLAAGERQTLPLELSLAGIPKGTIALCVREGATDLYFNHVAFPVAPDVIRTGFPADKPATPADDVQAEKRTPTEEEQAYAQKWTAEELGEALLESAEWKNNTLGLADDVPPPWTPMEVDGQTVRCWGRAYVYRDSLLPVQIETADRTLLAKPARFTLKTGGKTLTFDRATVAVERVNDALVRVNTSARSGAFLLELATEYEFDGMARIETTLSCPEDSGEVEALNLEFPLRADRLRLYHVTSSKSGHAPLSTSDALGKESLTLDDFREVVWLGDVPSGFCWFAESMQNWRIRDERAIQVLEAEKHGARLFRVKLAEVPFRPEQPWKMVFGLQATPVKPRPADFRKRSDKSAIVWRWFWGDGEYYPFHTDYAAKAREIIAQSRAKGQEVMPCSSILFYGTYRQHVAQLGKLSKPGLMHREVMLWGPLWSELRRLPTAKLHSPDIPSRHTAPGNWFGKRYAPGGLQHFCSASSWQDYYLWRLEREIRENGLGAIYLDQPITPCANPNHGCGYIDYKGDWSPSTRIFAKRRMMKRIYRLFHDAHGRTLIKWHGSNQIVPPIFAFIDIFWDGENYGHGRHKVFEFYSKVLPPNRMQAQHTGIPFGFAPDLLPEFEERYAPSTASAYDMMGLFMVHDSTVWPAHMLYPGLAGFLQDKRLAYPLETMETVNYWTQDGRVRVSPEPVKWILHHRSDQMLLILFNWSDEVVDAAIELDLTKLGFKAADAVVNDSLNGASLGRHPRSFTLAVQPRNLRMVEIVSGTPKGAGAQAD